VAIAYRGYAGDGWRETSRGLYGYPPKAAATRLDICA